MIDRLDEENAVKLNKSEDKNADKNEHDEEKIKEKKVSVEMKFVEEEKSEDTMDFKSFELNREESIATSDANLIPVTLSEMKIVPDITSSGKKCEDFQVVRFAIFFMRIPSHFHHENLLLFS